MSEPETLRVVMIPFPAFGHLIPYLQFSIALAKTGVQVYYIATPRNIKRLPNIPPEVSPLVKFVEVPLPELDRQLLPESAEATMDVPIEKIHQLMAAHDQLQHPVKNFVVDISPDYIFTDSLTHWVADIAQECHIPLIYFSVFSSSSSVFFGPPEYLVGDGQKKLRSSPESFTKAPEWLGFPSMVAYSDFDVMYHHPRFYGINAPGIPFSVRLAKVLSACQAVAIRSCPELEGMYLAAQEKMLGKPVIPVGLLLPGKPENAGIADEQQTAKIFQWHSSGD